MFNAFSVAALLIFLSLKSLPVFACSCDYSPIETKYKQAIIVFEGEVLDKSKPTFGDCYEKVRLRVDKLYKGIGGKEVEITNGRCTSCDRRMDIGGKYVFFLSGDNPANLGVDFCGGTYGISPHRDDADKIAFFNERQRQLQLLDAAILTQPENRLVLMKLKAEHLLFWRDDQIAQIVLNDILSIKPEDDWATDELMGVYHRLGNAQEILKFQTKGRGDQTKRAVSFATFSVAQEVDENFRLRLENSVFKELDRPKLKFAMPIMIKVGLISSNFSGSSFRSAQIEDSTIIGTNLSNVLLDHASIRNSAFQSVNLSGADLSGAIIADSKFHSVNMKNAILSGVKLDGTSFDCASVWPDGFDPVAAGARPMSECK